MAIANHLNLKFRPDGTAELDMPGWKSLGRESCCGEPALLNVNLGHSQKPARVSGNHVRKPASALMLDSIIM